MFGGYEDAIPAFRKTTGALNSSNLAIAMLPGENSIKGVLIRHLVRPLFESIISMDFSLTAGITNSGIQSPSISTDKALSPVHTSSELSTFFSNFISVLCAAILVKHKFLTESEQFLTCPIIEYGH
ncbi:MAG: hypothetical protein JPMHGGIA_02805 [Saprospiraceae bacterium]|nr:hypothetical protein [Saprospiraceae bacterium]